MDLSTTYLGMNLRTPLVASASPLSEDVDIIRQMEDAGISAVVLYSLFEEQLVRERFELHHHLTYGTYSFAEALSYFPELSEFKVGPEEYLEHIRKAKEAVRVPIVASLNGSSDGGWVRYAREMEGAGADAIELNVYFIPTDPDLPGEEIEQRYLDVVRAVKAEVRVPVAVKIGPHFSNLANMARRIEEAGADGLVLFNRFYQPDIDLETLEVVPNLLLSTPQAMRLPLRWIAILRDQLKLDIAATSGIHWADDALKMLLVGADVTMLCSTLLSHGVGTIRTIEDDMRAWLERHEYVSVKQMRGSMSQRNCPSPSEFERAQYIRTLRSFGPRGWR
jgi:dihydroorotate dehydrogenase (fumarate)